MSVRLCEKPFPSYSYVPGLFPHPESDPQGHSFGQSKPNATAVSDENWWQNQVYLYGFDLFNHGYYWEAHEQWESLWHVAGRKGILADLLKTLVKFAAAGVKVREQVFAGAISHASRAQELLGNISIQIAPKRRLLGLDLDEYHTIAQTIIDGSGFEKVSRDSPVEIVFSFELFPSQE